MKLKSCLSMMSTNHSLQDKALLTDSLKKQIKASLGACLFLLTFIFCTAFVSAETKAKNNGDLYYLSSTGYLIRLDIEKITETGQVAAGLMPWGATSCGGHIYFTDFALDQVYDFFPSEKTLNKIKIDPKDISYKEIDLVSKEETKKNKSVLVSAFSKVHKAKVKPPTYDANSEPLPVADHNRKIGLASIACNLDYVFVSSTLKDRIEVLSRKDLSRISSILVGERPSGLAVSEDGNTLAISSTGANKVYLVNNLNGEFAKQAEITVGTGPTEIAWLGNEKIFILNRGSNNVSVINASNPESNSLISFEIPINSIASSKGKNKVYILAGVDKKLFLVNPDDLSFKDYSISDALKFPNLLNIVGDKDGELLIGSEADGRFIVFDVDKLEFTRKIQTNLPPKTLITLVDEISSSGKIVEIETATASPKTNEASNQNLINESTKQTIDSTSLSESIESKINNEKIEDTKSQESIRLESKKSESQPQETTSNVYDMDFDSETNTQSSLKNSNIKPSTDSSLQKIDQSSEAKSMPNSRMSTSSNNSANSSKKPSNTPSEKETGFKAYKRFFQKNKKVN